MRCYQIVEWGKPLEMRERETPKPRGTEVLLRVEACGVCHSDVHIRQGHIDLGGGDKLEFGKRGAALPLTLGHEAVGEVVALGPDAHGVAVGDKRIIFPWIGCGDCEWCRRGDEFLCATPKFIGARVDGGYSDTVLVPDAKYLIPYGDVPTALACVYACSGITAYSALKKAGPLGAGDSLLITGAGGVGLNALHIARAMFDAKVIVADIDADKRAAAEAAGATAAIDNGSAGAVESVRELSGGGVAASVDFVGMPTSSRFGIDCLRKSATHVIVGLYGDRLALSLALFPVTQLCVRGSYVGRLDEMGELMALVTAGKVPALPVHTRPLAEANAALDDLEAGKIVGRYVLEP